MAAYISVLKGHDAGISTMHAQITTLMKIADIKNLQLTPPKKKPRTEVMKALSALITELQEHAIICFIDAIQTVKEL